jgi:hypothetical protein
VYPRADIEINAELPAEDVYWTPGPADLDDEEGFGLFRDVWLIIDISEEEASAMVAQDRDLSRVADAMADDASSFDDIATAVETGSAEGIEFSDDQLLVLGPYLDGIVKLDNLDLGVAGLVYALSAAGMYPAASSRGDSAWSGCPVVFLATDRNHAEILQPLVEGSGCGFEIDAGRRMLVICSASIGGTLNLAEAIISHMPSFAALGDADTSER